MIGAQQMVYNAAALSTIEPGDIVYHKNTAATTYTIDKIIDSRAYIINNTGTWPITDFTLAKKTVIQSKGNTMLNDMKNYFGKNKDIFFTLGAVLILDYFLFGGAMRKKIQDVVEKMLNKATNQVDQQ